MLITTKPHLRDMREGVDAYYNGERPHAYVEGYFRKRAFRCPGTPAPHPDDFLTTEQRILREVRAIRKALEGA